MPEEEDLTIRMFSSQKKNHKTSEGGGQKRGAKIQSKFGSRENGPPPPNFEVNVTNEEIFECEKPVKRPYVLDVKNECENLNLYVKT